MIKKLFIENHYKCILGQVRISHVWSGKKSETTEHFQVFPTTIDSLRISTLVLQITVALVSNTISLFKDGGVWDMALADRGQFVSQICVIDSDY